jgi:hypothetical protein
MQELEWAMKDRSLLLGGWIAAMLGIWAAAWWPITFDLPNMIFPDEAHLTFSKPFQGLLAMFAGYVLGYANRALIPLSIALVALSYRVWRFEKYRDDFHLASYMAGAAFALSAIILFVVWLKTPKVDPAAGNA